MKNALQTLISKQATANPSEAHVIKALFGAYQNDELENVMPGDLEDNSPFIYDWHLLTKAEQKAFNKFSNAVYTFHHLDAVTGCYVNQDNHYKVYGYYENVTVDHIQSYNKLENQDYTNPLFFPR